MPRAYHIQPEEFDLLLGEIDAIALSSPEEAEKHAHRILEFAERSGNDDLRVIAHAEVAFIFHLFDNGEMMEHHLRMAAEMVEGRAESVGSVGYRWRMAQIAMFCGRYQQVLAQAPEVAAMARRLGLRRFESCALYMLGTTSLQVGDLATGLEMALSVQRIEAEIEPGGSMHGFACFLIARAFERCRLFDRALENLDRVEEMMRGQGPFPFVTTNKLRAMIHGHRREWSQAYRHFTIAHDLLKGYDSSAAFQSLYSLYSCWARTLQQEGRYGESREMLHKAWSFIPQSYGTKAEMELLPPLAAVEEAEGNYERAVEYLRRSLLHHREAGNRWFQNIVLVQLARCLRAMGDVEGRNEVLEQQLVVQRELGVRVSLDSMLLLIGRDEEAEREREIQHLRLQREMLEREMRRRMHELSTIALSLRQRDELIATIERRIRDEIGKGSGDVDMLRELHAMVAEGSGESWADFTRQVDDVHGEFVRALAARNPTLTPTELKVCCLLRVNLSTKEIARLLGVGAKSVELYRSRIRRKLGIDGAIHLPSALLAM